MARPFLLLFCFLAMAGFSPSAVTAEPRELRIGIAGHAFDHLGAIGEQAEAAVASGATVLYITGIGTLGYQGLPSIEELHQQQHATKTYIKNAKQKGLQLALGYVCATSIVKLESFDKDWSAEFRGKF